MRTPNAPVFIVGVNGSGTTMLLDHLNHHPSLYGFRLETKLLPYYLQRLPRYGDLGRDANYLKLWNDMRSAFPFWRVNLHRPVPLPIDWRSGPRGIARIFDYLMGFFAVQENKMRWCEKTPMYLQHMLAIGREFETAQFIHVIRDGRDCAASFDRRWGYNHRSTIYRWKKSIEDGRRQGKALGERYMEVCYENFTDNPEQGMRTVCKFLSLPFEAEILKSSRYRPRSTGNVSPHIVPNRGGYRTFFNAREIRAMELIAGRQLQSLGYALGYSPGNEDPPALLLTFWHCLSWVKNGMRLVVNAFRSKKSSPIRLIYSRVRNAIQQFHTNRY